MNALKTVIAANLGVAALVVLTRLIFYWAQYCADNNISPFWFLLLVVLLLTNTGLVIAFIRGEEV